MVAPHVDLMRPAPGIARCCICFTAWPIDRLWVDLDGVRWDVCVPCAVGGVATGAVSHPAAVTMPCHDHDHAQYCNPLGWTPDPGQRRIRLPGDPA